MDIDIVFSKRVLKIAIIVAAGRLLQLYKESEFLYINGSLSQRGPHSIKTIQTQGTDIDSLSTQ